MRFLPRYPYHAIMLSSSTAWPFEHALTAPPELFPFSVPTHPCSGPGNTPVFDRPQRPNRRPSKQ
jgi:hypothetical protein